MTSDEKLLLLAQRLRDIPPEQFDLAVWGTVEPLCDTICCAVGHATFIPEFRALGFGNGVKRGSLFPTFGEYQEDRTSFSAVMSFFEIGFRELCYLFTEESYVVIATEIQVIPWQVANRIEEFVARRNAKIVPKKIGVFGA